MTKELIEEAREAAVRSALWDIPHLLFRLADALEAAVPDAATEELRADELTADEAIELVLKRPGMYGLTRTDEFRKVEAERDATLAAVERVRAIDTGNNRALYGNDFEAGMAKALWLVKTALDGAPEPEVKPCDAEVHSWDHFRPEQIDSYWIRCTMLGKHDEHEDSHTGLKWRSGLPVEGESK